MKKKQRNKSERPILQFSILCDGIATPQEMRNKPVFIGVFSNLTRPMTIPQFFVVNRWINGYGEHTQSIKILNPKLKIIAEIKDSKFSLPSKANSADIYAAFVNLNFKEAGVYWVNVDLDGKVVMSYPLPVFEEK